MTRVRRSGWAGLALLLVSSTALAAEPANPKLKREVRELRGKVAELETSRDEALRQLEELRATVAGLKSEMQAARAFPPLDLGGGSAVPAIATGTDLHGQLQVAQGILAQQTPGTAAEGAPETGEEVGTDKAEQRRFTAQRAILERQGGVLVPAGQLVVEPGFQYTNQASNFLNIQGFRPVPPIVIGTIESAAIDRNFYTAQLDARYGLHRRVELELSVPWGVRTERFEEDLGGPNEDVLRQSSSGIGDVQFGAFTQLLYQREWWPDTVLNLLVQTPTGEDPFEVDEGDLPLGSGTWGMSAGLTFVRTLDPAVLFGNIRYQWNLENDFQNDTFDGEVDFGDVWEYSGGVAFSLNERFAYSVSVQQSIIGRTEVEGIKIQGSDLNVARVFLGGSYRMSPIITANLAVGIGLTEDAPDYSIELSFPLRLPYELPHF